MAKMTSSVSDEQGVVPEWVLLDAGANEACRPLDLGMNFSDRNKYLDRLGKFAYGGP